MSIEVADAWWGQRTREIAIAHDDAQQFGLTPARRRQRILRNTFITNVDDKAFVPAK